MAITAREPPMSGLPSPTEAVPSSLICSVAEDSPPAFIHQPAATPRPWLGPSGAL